MSWATPRRRSQSRSRGCPRSEHLGYPAALVAQDGLTDATTPWSDLDVLFLGGSTAWKPDHSPAVGEHRGEVAASGPIWAA